MVTPKPLPQTAKAFALSEHTLKIGGPTISVGRSSRLMDFGSVQIPVVDVGYAAARDKLADVIRAAVGQGIKFHIGNERNPMAGTVVLMAPGELGKLVDPALRKCKRKGAEILSGMPFAGTGLPTLRLTAHDNDTQALRVPTTARDMPV